MKRIRRVLFLMLVMVVCVGCDQATKRAAKTLLPRSGVPTTFHNFITLVYTENPGAFLSLGATWPTGVRFVVFTVAAVLLLAVVCAVLLRAHRGSACQQMSLALIVGGGVGNLIDRLTHHGCVVDFMHLAIGPVHTGVFNVADVAIMGGVLLLMASLCRDRQMR